MRSLIIGAALAVLSVPVMAQVVKTFPLTAVCAPEEVTDRAMRSPPFSRVPILQGVTNNGQRMEIYFNLETRSFAIVQTGVDGWSCVVHAGEGLEPVGVIEGSPS